MLVNRLVIGWGSLSRREGCWMTTLSHHAGQTSCRDRPDDVCPVIRRVCITIHNSLSSDRERGEVIWPRLYDPCGSATTDESVMKQRAMIAANFAVRVFAARNIRERQRGVNREARDADNAALCLLDRLRVITDDSSAMAGVVVARAMREPRAEQACLLAIDGDAEGAADECCAVPDLEGQVVDQTHPVIGSLLAMLRQMLFVGDSMPIERVPAGTGGRG